MDIIKLVYKGEVVGYRLSFAYSGESFDVSVNALLKTGIYIECADETLELVEENNMLITEPEKLAGVVYKDVSGNEKRILELFAAIG